MTPETYYTIRRIQSPCKSESAVLFDLTYRRVWRPELGDQGQWCDLLVEQKEVETDQFPPVRLDEKLDAQFEGYSSSGKKVGVFSEVYPALRLLESSGSISVNSSTTKIHSAKGRSTTAFRVGSGAVSFCPSFSLARGDGMFMSFSSPSTTLIRLGFPAIFEVGVRDPLRRVASCRPASARGFLR